jgi:hypothetical protein
MAPRKRTAIFVSWFAFLFALPPDAAASLDVGVTVTELTGWSTAVVVATTLESTSAWEGTRIVTLERIHVDRLVAGGTKTDELIVKTLGGKVGGLGQIVEGEAELAPGTRWMLFLRESTDGTSSVTARAQGQFLVSGEESTGQVVFSSPHLGKLLQRRAAVSLRPAASELAGLSFESAARAIRVAWDKTHAP